MIAAPEQVAHKASDDAGCPGYDDFVQQSSTRFGAVFIFFSSSSRLTPKMVTVERVVAVEQYVCAEDYQAV